MRFHIPGLPHTITNKDYLSCAYTQKVRKLCAMLSGLGHEVYHYGCEGSDVIATEDVSIVSREELWASYPYESNSFFRFDRNDPFHRNFHERAAAAIENRRETGDFVLCAWGWGHEPITSKLKSGLYVVESGIGYEDTFSEFRIFESYTWMAHVYGLQKQSRPSWYDAVIPNFFDPDEFEYRDEKGDYFLYLGRLVRRKGLDVAAQTTAVIGAKLIVAGPGKLVDPDEGMNVVGDHIDHVGFADMEMRRELLAGAKALFVPTYYLEPFGGVIIEAALSGTPVITTDWGVFPENVIHGVTGYRCRTLEQFVWAARNIHRIRPADCRKWAVENFSMDRIALMYQEYFEMLQNPGGRGWYELHPGKKGLDWLTRVYPEGAIKDVALTLPDDDVSGNYSVHIVESFNGNHSKRLENIANFLSRNHRNVIWYGESCPDEVLICRKASPDDIQSLAELVRNHSEREDILLCSGIEQAALHEELNGEMLVVEMVSENENAPYASFRIFDSLWRMQHVYGRIRQVNGVWYDCVLPPAFALDDYDAVVPRGDYFLYRDVPDGGLNVAEQITAEMGLRLVVAYPYDTQVDPGQYPANKAHVEILSIKDERHWRCLLSGARALLLPSYAMTSGDMALEAAFLGIPVISSDWGGATEYVIHGVTGYRCRTFDQFRRALEEIDRISPDDCREFARTNFSETRVMVMYEEYFRMLRDLWRQGWYESYPERKDLDWLTRIFPGSSGVKGITE